MQTEFHREKREKIISYAVFFTTLAVIIPVLVTLLFPALIVTVTSPFPDESINIFELGIGTVRFISAMVLVAVVGILYLTKRLPNFIQNKIDLLFEFEISKKATIAIIVILLLIYIGFSAPELAQPEQFPDFSRVDEAMEDWPFSNPNNSTIYHYHAKMLLLYISENVFQNLKFIPFLGSIALLVVTYLFTVELAKKRFSGIIAMTIVLTSQLFLLYDTTPTYSNFWTLFYLLSLYLVTKKWQLSGFSYILSILSKPLTIGFFPMTIFYIFRSEIPKKKKKLTLLSYGIIFGIGLIAILALGLDLLNLGSRDFSDFQKFWSAYAVIGTQFRFDMLFLVFLLPLTIALFMMSRKGIKQAEIVMVLILGTLLSAPLTGLAGGNVHPYRFIPFITFFAVGVGLWLSTKFLQRQVNSP